MSLREEVNAMLKAFDDWRATPQQPTNTKLLKEMYRLWIKINRSFDPNKKALADKLMALDTEDTRKKQQLYDKYKGGLN